jgi:hypothetical protein
MKSTLPFFAFVSLNITPYVNHSAKDYNGFEYLPDSNKIQREKIADHEEPSSEIIGYNKEQA